MATVETRTTTIAPNEETKNYGMAFGIVVAVFLLIILVLVSILVAQGFDFARAETNTSTGQGLVWSRTSGGNLTQTITSGSMRFALWSDGYAYVVNTTTGLPIKGDSNSFSIAPDGTATQMKFVDNWLELWNTNSSGNPIGIAAATWATPPTNDGPIRLALLPTGDLFFTTNNFSTPVVWQLPPPSRFVK
jgi:hypothetical protein